MHDGPVLVVGAGNSGLQIALDVAQGREVWLSGRDPAHAPQCILGKDLFWWLYRTAFKLSTDSPFGRRLRKAMANAGDIVVGIPESQLKQASITRVPRVTGVADGDPELADGRVVSTPNVMWATGFRYDDGWIDLPIFHDRGLLRYDRGVVREAPGLHCVGLPFLYCETLPWLAASAPMLNTSPRGFATAPAAVVERATRPSCRPSRVRRRVPAARHPYTLVRSLTNLLFRQCLPIYRVLTTSISNATSSFPRSRS